MTCSWWMDKWNLVYPSSEILLTNKKEQKLPPPPKREQTIDNVNNTDASWKQYTKWKKADPKTTFCRIQFMWIDILGKAEL